ncbi:MAG: hypothetical protein KGL51_07135 [Betaproteobacteria bacterium]|nr:hypothetical protein [Betaproteobacteria bacterium]MDE2123447.1 hypothetical protein [Betaproteobacteria bacterium]MDE2185462.1 hypothetical protein [Betaproteobacteria bacterium]MDE2324429.1 hypothetical protein [Betaproteobacteria bacterium]
MNMHLRNAWIRAGLVLVVCGWIPWSIITLVRALGGWPELSPIVPRLLFFFSGWPAVFCFVTGFFQVKRDLALAPSAAAGPSSSAAAQRPWMQRPGVRRVATALGLVLVMYGTNGMLHGHLRSAAVALAVGVVAVYWGFVGRLPLRFWR